MEVDELQKEDAIRVVLLTASYCVGAILIGGYIVRNMLRRHRAQQAARRGTDRPGSGQ